MKQFFHITNPRSAFFRINTALSICALSLASLTMASKANEVMEEAEGVEEIQYIGCEHYIGVPSCSTGWKFVSEKALSRSCVNNNGKCCKYISYEKTCSKLFNGVIAYESFTYKKLSQSFDNAHCSGVSSSCILETADDKTLPDQPVEETSTAE